MNIEHLKKEFQSKFGSKPRIFRSPGRINIIGEHIDYNNGFVMPAAIDKEIMVLMARSSRSESRLWAYDLEEGITFSPENYHDVALGWASYLVGVFDQLKKAGHHPGMVDCVFAGNIPPGAGLSSSAALECATLAAYCAIFNIDMNQMARVHLAQRAENEFVGVNCGIMDQFASVFSKKGEVIKLDCQNMNFTSYPLQLNGFQLVLVDSMVSHSLASSEYNIRRQQCEQGVKVLQKAGLDVVSLRDVTRKQLDQYASLMEPVIYKRCKYVVDEIARVQKAAVALENNDLRSLGSLLYETHVGLSTEYEVSCTELDFLVDFTRHNPSVLGSRLMGGGFGGCTLNLVASEEVSAFYEQVVDEFNREYSKIPNVYMVRTADGTSEIL
jgi:galactokinase